METLQEVSCIFALSKENASVSYSFYPFHRWSKKENFLLWVTCMVWESLTEWQMPSVLTGLFIYIAFLIITKCQIAACQLCCLSVPWHQLAADNKWRHNKSCPRFPSSLESNQDACLLWVSLEWLVVLINSGCTESIFHSINLQVGG